MDARQDLALLEFSTQYCRRCPLSAARQKIVFGDGNPESPLVLVGEAPGAQEDLEGRPFVGAAGKLLDKILAAIGFTREHVYITNTIMCRPPGNRLPTHEERAACRPFFDAKIEIIQPRMVVLLGNTALHSILDPYGHIGQYRGGVVEKDGVTYYPTYHPAALLRDPAKKKPAWDDFQRIRDDYLAIANTAKIKAAEG